MTRQQELELLAEWLGVYVEFDSDGTAYIGNDFVTKWDPSPEGNDTDFLNMVAGRVKFEFDELAYYAIIDDIQSAEYYADHNNDKLAAMKHAAYQVCLAAAREWKEGQ